MNRILFFICSLVFVNIIFAQNQFVIGDLTYQVKTNNNLEVIACDTSAIVVNIPASVNYEGVNYNVTSIGNDAFQYRLNLTSITIPEGVVNIGDKAFYCCGSLSSVALPESLVSIGNKAFSRCGSLDSISIPYGVIRVGDYAFAGTEYSFFNSNPRFTSIFIPSTVNYLGKGAFAYCTNLVDVVFEEGSQITSFASSEGLEIDGMFVGCTALTSINLPQNLLNLGNYTFYNCKSLTNIDIPQDVSYIGKYAFSNCNELSAVYLPDNAEIDSTAFYNVGIKYINGLTYSADLQLTVGDYSFYHIGGLITFYLQNQSYTATLEEMAVIDCDDNKSGEVVVLDSIKYAGVNYPVTSIAGIAFDNCCRISSIIIGNNITSIDVLFDDCTELTSLVVGKKVASICSDAFYFCENLNFVKTLATTPPTLGQNVFSYDIDTLIVPCGTMNNYMSTNWNYYWDPMFNSIIIEETSINEIITATINEGEIYTENGFNVNEAGTYTQIFTAENGCDSIVTLHLYINVSIEDVEEIVDVICFPNPTKGNVYFNQVIEEIKVINQQGNEVFRFFNTNSIKLETLPAGIYYLKMINNEKNITQKLIIN
jgi:hypothetical protein